MNTLKAKTTITCNTCGTKLKRVKSIKVYSDNENEAIEEANIKIKEWKKSMQDKNCRICESIINDLAE